MLRVAVVATGHGENEGFGCRKGWQGVVFWTHLVDELSGCPTKLKCKLVCVALKAISEAARCCRCARVLVRTQAARAIR